MDPQGSASRVAEPGVGEMPSEPVGAERSGEVAELLPEERRRLEERLKVVGARFNRERHDATVREIDANRAYYSSTLPTDPGLATPEDSEDEEFVFVSRTGQYFLVRLSRSQFPGIFELRDERRSIRNRLGSSNAGDKAGTATRFGE